MICPHVDGCYWAATAATDTDAVHRRNFRKKSMVEEARVAEESSSEESTKATLKLTKGQTPIQTLEQQEKKAAEASSEPEPETSSELDRWDTPRGHAPGSGCQCSIA